MEKNPSVLKVEKIDFFQVELCGKNQDPKEWCYKKWYVLPIS